MRCDRNICAHAENILNIRWSVLNVEIIVRTSTYLENVYEYVFRVLKDNYMNEFSYDFMMKSKLIRYGVKKLKTTLLAVSASLATLIEDIHFVCSLRPV